jgi:drug/metabolite transporter (DMT)-like permease
LAALAPAAFLLLNRVFSPQYMVTITAALLIACAIVGQSPRHTRGIVVLLTIAQAANLLIWPNTVPWWPLLVGGAVCGCSGGAGVAYGDDGAKGARRRLKRRRAGQ